MCICTLNKHKETERRVVIVVSLFIIIPNTTFSRFFFCLSLSLQFFFVFLFSKIFFFYWTKHASTHKLVSRFIWWKIVQSKTDLWRSQMYILTNYRNSLIVFETLRDSRFKYLRNLSISFHLNSFFTIDFRINKLVLIINLIEFRHSFF